MRGRKPKPVEVRRREGNPQHRPLPQPVLVKGRHPLKRSADLPRYAAELWDEVVPSLEEVGLVDAGDRAALEAMCVQYDRCVRARLAIAEEGLFTTGSMGQIVEHPAVKIERDAAAAFLRYAEHYALTPVARTRLGLAEIARRTMAEELMDRLGRNPRATGGVSREVAAQAARAV